MITKLNLKWAFDSITEKELTKAMEHPADYVLLIVHSFNVGSYVTLEPHEYDETLYNEVNAEGNLFIDKDDFLRLFEESGSDNPIFEEYI